MNHPVSTDSLKFICLQVSQQLVKINVWYVKIDKLFVFLFWVQFLVAYISLCTLKMFLLNGCWLVDQMCSWHLYLTRSLMTDSDWTSHGLSYDLNGRNLWMLGSKTFWSLHFFLFERFDRFYCTSWFLCSFVFWDFVFVSAGSDSMSIFVLIDKWWMNESCRVLGCFGWDFVDFVVCLGVKMYSIIRTNVICVVVVPGVILCFKNNSWLYSG